MKGSTLSAFVAKTALVFAVVIAFTREVVLEVAEAVLAKQHLDWQFRQVTKKTISLNLKVFRVAQRQLTPFLTMDMIGKAFLASFSFKESPFN